MLGNPQYLNDIYLQVDPREARKKFLTFFKLLSGFSFKMLGNPLYLNDIYLQVDQREARKRIFDFFQTFEWIFLQNVRKSSIFE